MPNDTALFPGHRQRSRGSTNHNQTYLLRHLKCIWRVHYFQCATWYCIQKIILHFAPWPFWEQESVYYVFLVRQIMFLASRGFIEKVFYCQITDKASKTLRRYYCDRKSKGTRSIKYFALSFLIYSYTFQSHLSCKSLIYMICSNKLCA
jgi:dolichol kinase